MNYYDVLRDLKNLIGVPLQSIRPGSNIMIVEITESSIVINTASNAVVRRSLTEIRKIVDNLVFGFPVHVETVLAGSGSSRNQPETIMANLPYIEWLKIRNKKHIIWVKRNTHLLGTVKEMDAVTANVIKTQYLARPDGLNVMTAVFASDISTAIKFYSKTLGINPIYQGVDSAVFRVHREIIIVRHRVEGIPVTGAPVVVVSDISKFVENLCFCEEQINAIAELPDDGVIPRQLLVTGRFGDAFVVSVALHLEL